MNRRLFYVGAVAGLVSACLAVLGLRRRSAERYDLDSFIKVESRVWDALVAGDSNADGELLADHFLGVYGSGFLDKARHIGQLGAGPVIETYKLSEARLLALTEGVVLLSYLAEWSSKRTKDASIPNRQYVSSIWQLHGDKWLNVFSQDTKAEGIAPGAA